MKTNKKIVQLIPRGVAHINYFPCTCRIYYQNPNLSLHHSSANRIPNILIYMYYHKASDILPHGLLYTNILLTTGLRYTNKFKGIFLFSVRTHILDSNEVWYSWYSWSEGSHPLTCVSRIWTEFWGRSRIQVPIII